ncbi:MAG: LysE family transporter, partial [Aliarcobacter sp.]|nr:LysE family transporter [Aliarcobacter sp.]
FLAFLPQFTNPNLGSITLQMLLLGILFLIAALLVFSLIALYCAKLGKIINKSDKSQKILNKLVSLVFVALAIKLISTKQ